MSRSTSGSVRSRTGRVDHARLAEAAAARTTSEQLEEDAVVDDFGVRNDAIGREIRLVEIEDDPLADGRRDSGLIRLDHLDGAVWL